jgi:hypothetical protein
MAVSKFKFNRSGQGTIEYILILMIAVGIALLLSRGVKGIFDKNVSQMGGRIEQAMKAGRLPQNAWKQ